MDCGESSRANLLQSRNLLRSSNEYARVVEDYLDHVFSTRADGDEITCPCKKCFYRYWHQRDEVYDHLIVNGIDSKIKEWPIHEKGTSSMSNKKIDSDNSIQISMSKGHTTGPVSFARKHSELEQAAKIPPSEVKLYTETCKRKPERKYETSYALIEHNNVQTQEQRTLSGRCTKRVKGSSKSGMLIPDEFLQSYKTQIVKETVGEVMKILQELLASEILARINRQSSSGINDIDRCQNNGSKDAEANEHDDLERNGEGSAKIQ